MPTVHFCHEGVSIDVEMGTTVLEAAKSAKVLIGHSCGGQGMCSSCRVEVAAGEEHLSRISRAERRLLDEAVLERHGRLACQAMIQCLTVSVKTRQPGG